MENKRAKVIMLPTDNTKKPVIFKYMDSRLSTDFKRQPASMHHLYFTTDDEIKEGDWCIVPHLGRECIKQIKEISKTGMAIHGQVANLLEAGCKLSSCRKIIATTDTLKSNSWIGMYKEDESYLPQPSQAFIKKYCELSGIDEVLVEYCRELDSILLNRTNSWIPKVDPVHNTITIREIKQLYSPQEILELLELHGEEKLKQILIS